MADFATTIRALSQRGAISADEARRILEAVRSEPLVDGPPGERFGRFVLVEKIGEGGMGAVWKAYQTDLRRTVAVKFVKDDDPEILARFIREAQTAAGLSHPNIEIGRASCRERV